MSLGLADITIVGGNTVGRRIFNYKPVFMNPSPSDSPSEDSWVLWSDDDDVMLFSNSGLGLYNYAFQNITFTQCLIAWVGTIASSEIGIERTLSFTSKVGDKIRIYWPMNLFDGGLAGWNKVDGKVKLKYLVEGCGAAHTTEVTPIDQPSNQTSAHTIIDEFTVSSATVNPKFRFYLDPSDSTMPTNGCSMAFWGYKHNISHCQGSILEVTR